MNSAIFRTAYFLAGGAVISIAASMAQAQQLPGEGAAPVLPAGVVREAPKPPVARVPSSKPTSTPAWNELSPAQQQALQPLATHWSGLDEAQKRKWLAMSRNFGTWPPAEQAKLHGRMTEWVALSPRQRTLARLNFAETKKVPVDEKKARWETYQSLSPEEKRKLAASGPAQPPGVANALKPVPPQKLATPPQAKAPGRVASGTGNVLKHVDKNTLLPRPVGKNH